MLNAGAPLIPNADVICVHTNVINWEYLKRKRTFQSSEIVEYSKHLFRCWKKANARDLRDEKRLHIECCYHTDVVPEEEKDHVIFTVKLSLFSWDESTLTDAVEKLLKTLGVDAIDSFLISFPSDPPSVESVTRSSTEVFDDIMEHVCSLWRVLEQFALNMRILRLGVCDFLYDQLAYLHGIAQIKPQVNSINMTSCNIPTNLRDFSKLNNIQLLVHNDSHILPATEIRAVLAETFSKVDSQLWAPAWVIRYCSIYRTRGILRGKGYMYELKRDSKQLRNIVAFS